MAFRGAGRWSRWSRRQLRVAGAAACVVAAVLQTRLWAHGVSAGEGCGRGSALLGQLLWVTPASWLKAPKRRGRGRRTSALEERGRGRRRRDNWLGKQPLVATVARTRRRPCWRPVASVESGVRRGWRSFGSRPHTQAVAQFSWNLFDPPLPSPCLEMPLAGVMTIRRLLQVSSFLGEEFGFKLFMRAVTQF